MKSQPQMAEVRGMVRNIPKPPTKARKNSTMMSSVFKSSKRLMLEAVTRIIRDMELPMYARIRVFSIVPKMSLPISSPDLKMLPKEGLLLALLTSQRDEDMLMATSIIAPVQPIMTPAKITARMSIGTGVGMFRRFCVSWSTSPVRCSKASMEYIMIPANITPPRQPKMADTAFLLGPMMMKSVDMTAYTLIMEAAK